MVFWPLPVLTSMGLAPAASAACISANLSPIKKQLANDVFFSLANRVNKPGLGFRHSQRSSGV